MNKSERKVKGSEVIEKYCLDGDVINLNNHPPFWRIITNWILRIIRKKQGKIFLNPYILHAMVQGIVKKFNANDDTHTMIYFKNESIKKYIGNEAKINDLLLGHPDITTFSVEPPKATFVLNIDYSDGDISVYRYCRKRIDERDTKIMLQATLLVLGTWYDLGQLLSILVDEIAGYPNVEKNKVFDFGAKYKVCSTGVASVYANWRHTLEKIGVNLPRLFSILNPAYWKEKFVKEFNQNGNKWMVERTYPAQFSNIEHFNNDFRLILKMLNGEVVYLNI